MIKIIAFYHFLLPNVNKQSVSKESIDAGTPVLEFESREKFDEFLTDNSLVFKQVTPGMAVVHTDSDTPDVYGKVEQVYE